MWKKNNQNYHPGTEPQQNSRVATPISHPFRNTEKQAETPEQKKTDTAWNIHYMKCPE